MDEILLAKDIINADEDITVIEDELNNNDIVHFHLYGNEFVMFCPDREKPSSTASVYILNDCSYSYPHIMLKNIEIKDNSCLPDGNYRYICLFEAESVVFSLQSYEEKIIDALERLKALLSLSKLEIEKELQKEFSFYWNSVASSSAIKLFIGENSCYTKLNIYQNKFEVRYVDPQIHLNDLDKYNKAQRVWQQRIDICSFYIPLIDVRGVIPPNKNHHWGTAEVKDLVYGKKISHIRADTLSMLKEEIVKMREIVLVFGMETNAVDITFAIKLKCRNTNPMSLFQRIEEEIVSIEELYCVRSDYAFLNKRIGNSSDLMNKNVLLIGAGSLGSYVASELVVNGFTKLTVYDGDSLSVDNLMRWRYEGFGIGCNKTRVLKLELECVHPEIQIRNEEKYIDEDSLTAELPDIDLIIFTVGSSDVQLELNQVLQNSGFTKPVLFVWLEAGGKYSHILKVDYSEKGCFECLFTDCNGKKINNKVNIAPTETIALNTIHNGCGGTRVAYGTVVLLRTTNALLEVIRSIYAGELQHNFLIDISPGATMNQGAAFIEKGCNCCGKSNPQ